MACLFSFWSWPQANPSARANGNRQAIDSRPLTHSHSGNCPTAVSCSADKAWSTSPLHFLSVVCREDIPVAQLCHMARLSVSSAVVTSILTILHAILSAQALHEGSNFTPDAEADRVNALPGLEEVKSGLFSG